MKLSNASSITVKGISWLWPGRIPCRATTLLEGDPGTSKSTLSCVIAAHVSQGRDWPDGTPCPQGHVVLANAEDPPEEIIAPRLIAAEADMDKISIIVPSNEEDKSFFTIPDNVPALEEHIMTLGVKLIVFDPLEAFLSGKTNTYSNHSVRQALRSLEQLSQKTDCSIVIVRHLNKDVGKAAIYRGGGSIGIIGAARASMLVVKDPANKMRCLVVPNKSNWSAIKNGLAYKTATTDLTAPTGEIIQTSRIVWDGEVDLSANDVLQPSTDLEGAADLDDGADFLRFFLKDGPRSSAEVFSEAGKQGILKKVIYRAAKLTNVIKYPEGHGPGQKWVWELPASVDSDFLKDLSTSTVDENEDD